MGQQPTHELANYPNRLRAPGRAPTPELSRFFPKNFQTIHLRLKQSNQNTGCAICGCLVACCSLPQLAAACCSLLQLAASCYSLPQLAAACCALHQFHVSSLSCIFTSLPYPHSHIRIILTVIIILWQGAPNTFKYIFNIFSNCFQIVV